jgi:hypothetical protein
VSVQLPGVPLVIPSMPVLAWKATRYTAASLC